MPARLPHAGGSTRDSACCPLSFASPRRGRGGVALARALFALACCLGPARGAAGEPTRLTVVDPLTAVAGPEDLQGVEGLEAIRLVGPRNGVCSAQVVAQGYPPAALAASVSALTSAAGAIPQDAVRIRYALKRTPEKEYVYPGAAHPTAAFTTRFVSGVYYDVLAGEPPPGEDLVPIWVTVSIPADARPGRYSGTLRACGREVPVELTVCPWRCPDPRDWVTHVGLMHSPETLADYYNVAMWSEEHFALLARTFDFMGALGNKDVVIPVLHSTYMGNREGMVRFRVTPEGGHEPDFTILDRYLDLYKEHVGPPTALIVYLFDPGRIDRRSGRNSMTVTRVDAEGKATPFDAPEFGEPGSAQFWKPLLDGVRERVQRLGWPEEVILLGWAFDAMPSQATVKFLREIAPYARWAVWTHGQGHPVTIEGDVRLIDGMRVARYDMPWLPRVRPEDVLEGDGILGGWDLPVMQASSARDTMLEYVPPSQWRCLPEGTVGTSNTGQRNDQYAVLHSFSFGGFAHLCLDYSLVGDRDLLFATHARANRVEVLYRRHTSRTILAPGPDGAVATVRYEMLREGLQECEARIAIEKALVAGDLGDDLARRCTDLLKERVRIRTKDGAFAQYGYREDHSDYMHRIWGVAPDWQDLAERLFNLAGEATAAVTGG